MDEGTGSEGNTAGKNARMKWKVTNVTAVRKCHKNQKSLDRGKILLQAYQRKVEKTELHNKN